MSVVDIREAKTHLLRLVDEAVRGGDVIIARANKPLVKLVPVEEVQPPRRLGTAAGTVKIAANFDEPLGDFREYG